MSATRTKRPVDESVPQTPQGVPPMLGSGHGFPDHSFTLQAIMDLHKSVGELGSKMDAVKSSVDSTKSKVDDLLRWKNMILGGAVVLGVVIAVAWALMWKLSDYVAFKPPAALPSQTAPPPK